MSSFEATFAPAAPVAPVALAVIYFSDEDRSVVADYSPVLRPSAYAAAAALALSSSEGTPLLSLIS